MRKGLRLSFVILMPLSVPWAALAQDNVEMPYVPEERCSTILTELVDSDDTSDAELNFATRVCHASRLVDFKDRTENRDVGVDAGQTRSLPKADGAIEEGASEIDRQIETAAQRSEESWDELAQGDPKAAYDLLRRLIGDQGSGS